MVEAVQGSVQLGLDAVGSLPLTLAADEPPADLPVVLSVLRCDPHGQVEVTKVFVFGPRVRLGVSGTAVLVQPQLPDQLQRTLVALPGDCPPAG